jgi:hypothetical protein
VPSTLVIPLDALVSFADPQIRYGLRFDPIEPETKIAALKAVPAREPPSREPDEEPASEPAWPSREPQVVSLDAFRRRTPPKT